VTEAWRKRQQRIRKTEIPWTGGDADGEGRGGPDRRGVGVLGSEAGVLMVRSVLVGRVERAYMRFG
jgi:hypothetical protein